MIGTRVERKRWDINLRTWYWLGKTLCAAILVLGFSARTFAQSAPPPGKTFYYGGMTYDLSVNSGGGVSLSAWQAQSGPNWISMDELWATPTWPIASFGNVTGCVFNGLIYGFFLGRDPQGWTDLYSVTVDPVSHATTGPTAVILGVEAVYNNGVAAVVTNGQIVVFVSGASRPPWDAFGFTSTDGKNYSTFQYQCANGVKDFAVLDAITFEPSGSDPESVMLVYNDPDTSPATLRASLFSFQVPPWLITSTQDFTLPWPSASPSWQQVFSDGGPEMEKRGWPQFRRRVRRLGRGADWGLASTSDGVSSFSSFRAGRWTTDSGAGDRRDRVPGAGIEEVREGV